MDCFLYDNGLRHERVKANSTESVKRLSNKFLNNSKRGMVTLLMGATRGFEHIKLT